MLSFKDHGPKVMQIMNTQDAGVGYGSAPGSSGKWRSWAICAAVVNTVTQPFPFSSSCSFTRESVHLPPIVVLWHISLHYSVQTLKMGFSSRFLRIPRPEVSMMTPILSTLKLIVP